MSARMLVASAERIGGAETFLAGDGGDAVCRFGGFVVVVPTVGFGL